MCPLQVIAWGRQILLPSWLTKPSSRLDKMIERDEGYVAKKLHASSGKCAFLYNKRFLKNSWHLFLGDICTWEELSKREKEWRKETSMFITSLLPRSQLQMIYLLPGFDPIVLSAWLQVKVLWYSEASLINIYFGDQAIEAKPDLKNMPFLSKAKQRIICIMCLDIDYKGKMLSTHVEFGVRGGLKSKLDNNI